MITNAQWNSIYRAILNIERVTSKFTSGQMTDAQFDKSHKDIFDVTWKELEAENPSNVGKMKITKCNKTDCKITRPKP